MQVFGPRCAGGVGVDTADTTVTMFEQVFRASYVTAQRPGGVFTEVRIWGPRVLKNGGLGNRSLDHVWEATIAAGGIDLGALPTRLAEQLRTLD